MAAGTDHVQLLPSPCQRQTRANICVEFQAAGNRRRQPAAVVRGTEAQRAAGFTATFSKLALAARTSKIGPLRETPLVSSNWLA